MSITQEKIEKLHKECEKLIEKQNIESNYGLSKKQREQLTMYLFIYIIRGFNEHWKVNEFIDNNGLWCYFNELHSLNTHASGCQVDGIWPRYFAIICEALQITDSGGSHLISAEDPDKKRAAS